MLFLSLTHSKSILALTCRGEKIKRKAQRGRSFIVVLAYSLQSEDVSGAEENQCFREHKRGEGKLGNVVSRV
jgi:hypothetical protein